MLRYLFLPLLLCASFHSFANDNKQIERAVLDYIESQHKAQPELMARGLDPKLAKRTFWKAKDGSEFIMETDHATMLKVAESYNKDGNRFPAKPRVEIAILDVDQRVASVKLTVDEWIDYIHLYKNDKDEWKILNVLWQYHDVSRQVSSQ
ncbi:nuclear transport factor 2 family protein [Shewanella sedimentimangrovi]|uniref:Nuclear transport factor 2 family protein n=1 Tax=Shewanella sedimentimangrovi TaxID=2814293 RepID=A0ABX7R3L0_9GAMM|nr:nuclear transport factor 2 family protein [Shewanella sedimentimangrovi]QSX38414.1 nuclear transport factor 2 family protein [Shewanella sedimentimangrovi]